MTPNNNIPLVPENATDPAAGLNLALDKIDSLLQLAVLDISDAPPSESLDGDRHIVGVGTRVWAGEDNRIARYVAAGDYRTFADARIALNLFDGRVYVFDGASWNRADLPASPPAVTGDKATQLATVVGNLLTALDGLGLIDDQTT